MGLLLFFTHLAHEFLQLLTTMNSLSIITSLLICGIILWLLYELTRTAKHLSNTSYNHNRSSIVSLVVILVLIILIAPYLFTSPIFDHYRNVDGSTGGIGDTIGGITAPFINGIAAILVYLAFKEQIKANALIQEQQYFQHIQHQIQRLEDDLYNLSSLTATIKSNITTSSTVMNNYDNGQQVAYYVDSESLNKLIYITTMFQDTLQMIDKIENNRAFMKRKLRLLYVIIYKDELTQLHQTLFRVTHMQSNVDGYIAELLLQIQRLNNTFKNIN